MKNERRSILKAKKEILRVKAKRVEHLEKKLARKTAALNKAKAEGNKKGEQFVKQPKTIAKKASKFR